MHRRPSRLRPARPRRPKVSFPDGQDGTRTLCRLRTVRDAQGPDDSWDCSERDGHGLLCNPPFGLEVRLDRHSAGSGIKVVVTGVWQITAVRSFPSDPLVYDIELKQAGQTLTGTLDLHSPSCSQWPPSDPSMRVSGRLEYNQVSLSAGTNGEIVFSGSVGTNHISGTYENRAEGTDGTWRAVKLAARSCPRLPAAKQRAKEIAWAIFVHLGGETFQSSEANRRLPGNISELRSFEMPLESGWAILTVTAGGPGSTSVTWTIRGDGSKGVTSKDTCFLTYDPKRQQQGPAGFSSGCNF